MVIKVRRNYLKLLSQQWMEIVPVKNDVRLAVGGKYEVDCKDYGVVGLAECMGLWECHLFELKDTAAAMADGHANTKDLLYAAGFNTLTKVQCARFRFVRRSDEAFKAILDKELVVAGLDIKRQGQLNF